MGKVIKKILLIRLNADLASRVGHPRAIRPPFILKYIQALASKRGYSVQLIDYAIHKPSLQEMRSILAKWQPDIAIICLTSLELDLIREFTNFLKANSKDILTVIVGQAANEKIPDYHCQGIDFIIKGEAELEIFNLIDRINKEENMDNLKASYKKELLNEPFIIQELDNLSFPFYSKQELIKYSFVYPLKIHKRLRWGHILSSRGCPNSCIFCSPITRESYGRKVRLRTPENVIDEIEPLILRGANIVSFDDDNFTAVEEHVKEVCLKLLSRNVKIKWICHARVDNLNEDLLILMKKAGCILLRCGIESGSERIINILHKGEHVGWHNKAKKAFSLAGKIGISTDALFLIGSPSETRDEIEESIELAESISPDIIQVAFFTPYPGSDVYEEYKNKLSSMPISQMYHYSVPLVNLSRVDLRELVKFQKRFYKRILLNKEFIFKHIFEYGIFYLYNFGVLFKLFNGAIKRVKE